MNTVAESLATLSWLQTRVTLRTLDPLQLPPYKGSTLRSMRLKERNVEIAEQTTWQLP